MDLIELEEAFGTPLPDPPARVWPWPPAEEVIPALVEAIVAFCQPLAVVLFGSRARGDHDPDSDVDLLVIVPQVADKADLVAGIRRAVLGIPVAKDIIVATPGEVEEYGVVVSTLLYRALREGKVLYDQRSQGTSDHQVA